MGLARGRLRLSQGYQISAPLSPSRDHMGVPGPAWLLALAPSPLAMCGLCEGVRTRGWEHRSGSQQRRHHPGQGHSLHCALGVCPHRASCISKTGINPASQGGSEN